MPKLLLFTLDVLQLVLCFGQSRLELFELGFLLRDLGLHMLLGLGETAQELGVLADEGIDAVLRGN